MSSQSIGHLFANRVLQALAQWMKLDLLTAVNKLWRLTQRAFTAKSPEGMYEVLDYEAKLELSDAQGKTAICHKWQRVRFLQDNVIAFQDQAWGDGEIFAKYKCAPGYEVDRYREGHRWRVLISLRETKGRGDIEEFRIQREIQNGFTKRHESFQVEISHKTERMTIGVVFPETRQPKRVTLVEQNKDRARALSSSHLIRLPDGRIHARWSTVHPRLFEAYIVQWEW